MTYKMGPKGQVVVPKALRDRAGLHPGGAVDFTWIDGRIVLAPAASERPLGGRFAKSGMAERLLADRASEPR
jgi:AbrB family looped-hinge helix DNA binding protein